MVRVLIEMAAKEGIQTDIQLAAVEDLKQVWEVVVVMVSLE